MDWLKIFRNERKATANVAKERLKLVVLHQREGRVGGPDWLPRLREDLLAVVRRYAQVADDAVHVTVQREDGVEMLEMNIALPEDELR
jgi:cell division topological specificity factor